MRQHTAEPARRLEVNVYVADGRHESTLYEDAGDGWDFERGGYWLGRIVLEATAARVSVTTHVEGAFDPEWEGWDVVVHGLAEAPRRVTVGGRDAEVSWDGRVARFEAGVGATVVVER